MEVGRQAEPRHPCASTLSLLFLYTLHIIIRLLAIILTWHLSFIAQYLTQTLTKMMKINMNETKCWDLWVFCRDE